MGTDQQPVREDGRTTSAPAPHGAARTAALGRGEPLSRIEPWIDIVWVAGGLTLCLYAQRLGAWGPSGPDSGFFPMVAGAIVLTGGVAQLLGVSRRRHRRDAADPARRAHPGAVDDPPFWDEPGASRRVLALLAGMVALILLVRHAGFIVAALATMPFLLRQVEKRSWPYAIAVAVIATAAVHVLFGKLLGMQMPRGPWGF